MTAPTDASRPRPGLSRLIALALGALVASTALACGGDGPTGPRPPENGSMRATVNGSAWSATIVNATVSNGFLGIYGGVAGVSEMAFGVDADAPGTFSIPESTGLNFNYIENGSGHQWQALAMGTQLGGVGSGTITITTLTANRVAGTFSYQAPAIERTGATGNANITAGSFDITY